MNSAFADISISKDLGAQSESKPLVYRFSYQKKDLNNILNWVKTKKEEIISNLNLSLIHI